MTNCDTPCVAVQAHDDTLNASTVLRCGTFGEQFVYLFLSSVEAEVADLCSMLSPDLGGCKCGARKGYLFLRAAHFVCCGLPGIENPCNWRVGPEE